MPKVALYRSLWGNTRPLPDLFQRLADKGFCGIEASIADVSNHPDFFTLLQQYNFNWICGIYTSWVDYIGEAIEQDVSSQVDQFKRQIETVATFPIAPILVNCHSGSDWFTLEESIGFFKQCLEIQQQHSYKFSHETHRGRILNNPFTALEIVKQLPDIQFTLDLSHWILVCERKIDLIKIRPILDRTVHIHARVSTTQQSQVADPTHDSVAEFKSYFEEAWNIVWNNSENPTATPEYGPLDDLYMPGVLQGKRVLSAVNLETLIESEAARIQSNN
jgi:sugar phosphate isomerase/epimerase